jgi:predicted Fe-S protein YdhL (DUF1289 family)
MGRMKEVYMQVMEANDGIPEGLTIGEMSEMKQMEIYNWELYEKEKRKNILLDIEDPEEIKKIELTERNFKNCLREDFEEREQEQKRIAKLYRN